jgi:alpha-tubulin suppressor-like RCC1 family protein
MIKTDGTLWATGNNSRGQLGDLTAIDRSSPVQIGPDSTWKYVVGSKDVAVAGVPVSSFTIAIKTDGTLWATGNNQYGQLAITGSSPNISSPVQIGSSTNWKQAACGDDHTLALKTNGTIWGWGRNNQGQVGDNTVIDRSSPVQIGTKTNWRQVACSTLSSYALASNQNYS